MRIRWFLLLLFVFLLQFLLHWSASAVQDNNEPKRTILSENNDVQITAISRRGGGGVGRGGGGGGRSGGSGRGYRGRGGMLPVYGGAAAGGAAAAAAGSSRENHHTSTSSSDQFHLSLFLVLLAVLFALLGLGACLFGRSVKVMFVYSLSMVHKTLPTVSDPFLRDGDPLVLSVFFRVEAQIAACVWKTGRNNYLHTLNVFSKCLCSVGVDLSLVNLIVMCSLMPFTYFY